MSAQKSIQNDFLRADALSKIDSGHWSNEDALFMRKHVKEMEEALRYKALLPHLGFKQYDWQRKIIESTNREIFVTSANQIGKSLCAVRKNIILATNPSLWGKYWPNLEENRYPSLFWYFLPTLAQCTTEVETKWIPFYLPQGEFKNHPQFGWKIEYFKGEAHAIIFNTGVTAQFKSYTQKVADLQTATVYHITLDEECPVEYLPELSARLNASDGHLLHVFTATKGQDYWRRTMEPTSPDEELHKDALKIQVSLYDSQYFDDGTPSPWTDAKIKRAIANCPTQAEVQRRIYGRFVKAHGLRYESFSLEKNMIDPHPIPHTWLRYGMVDVGSGGQSGHPAGIVFLAVSPDYKQGRVYRAWRGDGIPTAAPDILEKYREIKGQDEMTLQIYDYASADFHRVATQVGEAFVRADKSREAGSGLLNSLFKTGILKLFRGDPEIGKLVQELLSLPVDIDKRKAKDDLIDPTRYGVMVVPWDFSDYETTTPASEEMKKSKEPPLKTEVQLRREFVMGDGKPAEWSIEDEFDLWNSLSGASEGDS